jgi:flagellar protein FlaJ
MFQRSRIRADATPAPKSVSEPRAPVSGLLLGRYRAFCYRLLGERFDRRAAPEGLSERLKQAGVNATPGMHRAVILVTTLVSGAAAAGASFVLFALLLRTSVWYEYFGLITGVTLLATLSVFRLLVGTRISNRKGELERELPFTLSELSVLASTGMSPIDLVHRMARRTHDPAMTAEFKKIVYKTDIQGKDLISALAETAKESASLPFREALWDLANMIHQGGDLDEYLRAKSDDVLKLKRLVQKEFIERLQTFVDMYISLVLVGVLMIAVGAFLLNAFDSTTYGLSADALLLLLTYGLVPVATIMTAVLISMAYARAG